MSTLLSLYLARLCFQALMELIRHSPFVRKCCWCVWVVIWLPKYAFPLPSVDIYLYWLHEGGEYIYLVARTPNCVLISEVSLLFFGWKSRMLQAQLATPHIKDPNLHRSTLFVGPPSHVGKTSSTSSTLVGCSVYASLIKSGFLANGSSTVLCCHCIELLLVGSLSLAQLDWD